MSSADPKAGFTLIEVTAVMLIVALVASLAVTMTTRTGRVSLKSVSLNAASLLRRERLAAILSGQPRVVTVERSQRILKGQDGDAVVIPPEVVVDVLGPAGRETGPIPVVQFQPNGASSGGVLRLSREGVSYEVRVNWYTGAVAIMEGSP
jgi:general secretion pathway protein H